MSDALWLLAAFASAQLGMSWLALAMDVHWRQVHGNATGARPAVMTLRSLGYVALATSLLCCLRADTATMAVLVWMMLTAITAASTALVLSWRPRALAWTWHRRTTPRE
jgi:hypothetical protein